MTAQGRDEFDIAFILEHLESHSLAAVLVNILKFSAHNKSEVSATCFSLTSLGRIGILIRT